MERDRESRGSISGACIAVLREVAAAPSYGARIARRMGLSRSTVLVHLKRLGSERLVARENPESPSPWKTYRATDRGRALLSLLREDR